MARPDAEAPGASITVIGPCSSPGCDRPARLHLEVAVPGAVVRGAVCRRCERASLLGAVLLQASEGTGGAPLR